MAANVLLLFRSVLYLQMVANVQLCFHLYSIFRWMQLFFFVECPQSSDGYKCLSVLNLQMDANNLRLCPSAHNLQMDANVQHLFPSVLTFEIDAYVLHLFQSAHNLQTDSNVFHLFQSVLNL